MVDADGADTARLLRIVERVEALVKEMRAVERETQRLLANALDRGMCVWSFELGLALAHSLPEHARRKQPLRLSDFLRGGFLMPQG